MKDRVSARQLEVAVATGLLAPAAAVAGADWRGALCAIPVTVLAAYCWSALAPGKGMWAENWGRCGCKALSSIYIVWLVGLAGVTLAAAGERITAPGSEGAGWVTALVWIPVFLLAKGKKAVLGRTAEIFYLIMLAALVVVLTFGALQIEPERLFGTSRGFERAFLSAVGTGCTGVAMLLLWEGVGEKEKTEWVAWSGVSAVVLFLMRVVTVGTLGAVLSEEQGRPFFVMSVGLGQTARVEGLVSAVWLISDIVFAGVLAKCGCELLRIVGMKGERIRSWMISVLVLGAGEGMGMVAGIGFLREKLLTWGGIALGGILPLLFRLAQKADRKWRGKAA